MNVIRQQLRQKYRGFKKIRSWNSGFDGRYLLTFIICTYFLPILLVIAFSSDPERGWKSGFVYPFVRKMLPPFADMQVITAGAECIRLGYNVLLENPCDPWNRRLNYPPIWHGLAALGLHQGHTIILGIIFGLLFFIAVFTVIGRLNFWEALLYAAIICSPSLMLAVERGNNDLIIFILLVLVLFALQKSDWRGQFGAGLIILFAAILKLYPIFALASFVKYKKRKVLAAYTLFITIFAIYCVANWETLKLVSKATPRKIFYSYGDRVIFDAILFSPLKNLLRLFTNSIEATEFSILVTFLPTIFVLIIVLIAYRITQRTTVSLVVATTTNKLAMDEFRLGVSIYGGTFLLGNNWDYRLIFLLFTIPQLLGWLKLKSTFSRSSALVLSGIVLTTWWSADTKRWYYLDEAINWGLLFFFIYALLVTLPPTWKRLVGLRLSNAVE